MINNNVQQRDTFIFEWYKFKFSDGFWMPFSDNMLVKKIFFVITDILVFVNELIDKLKH